MIDYFIISHASAGGLALLMGVLALSFKKGQRWHVLTGKIFSICMIYAAISAIIISFVPGHESLFLGTIGVFSLYLIVSGWMYLKLKGVKQGSDVPILFKINAAMMLLAGLAMLIYGGLLLASKMEMGIVLIVFGAAGGRGAINDFQNIRKIEERPMAWLFGHIGNIIGGFIAATTAFLVQNQILPDLIAWLGPTVVGVPFIIYWTRRVKKRGLK